MPKREVFVVEHVQCARLLALLSDIVGRPIEIEIYSNPTTARCHVIRDKL